MIVTQHHLPAWHTSVADDRTDSAHDGGKIIYCDLISFKFQLVQCNTQACISRA